MDEVQEDDALFIMNQGGIVTRGQCGQLLNHYKQENVFDLYRYLTQPEGLI
jgi:ABC-2 type transport system ATP-binding protein